MPTVATETTSLIAITLPSSRYSAWMARYHVRVALNDHGLCDYADDAAAVTSELITNAVIHTDAVTIGLALGHMSAPEMISIVVTDSSPNPPEKRDVSDTAECGRGLCLVDALSARWGWKPRGTGKAVYAILTREE